MAVITPMGMDFDWSPKEKELVKTASTKAPAKTDKDLLYEAAKKVVKAQFMDLEKPMGGSMGGPVGASMDAPCGDAPCGDAAPSAVEEGMGDVVPDAAPEATDVAAPAEGEEGGDVGDVQKAVKELVDKANKAEEVAVKVQDAVGKVEQAVQEVKDAVGAAEGAVEGEGGVPEEVEIEVEDVGGDDDKGENPFGKEKKEKKDDSDDDAGDKDDKGEKPEMEKESKDKKEASSKKALEMKSAAAAGDDLAKFASLSPSVKKKIFDYWKNDLKYAPDYCKLLVTDS